MEFLLAKTESGTNLVHTEDHSVLTEPVEGILYSVIHMVQMYVLHTLCPIGTYVWAIKHETRGRIVPEGECFISHAYRIWA